MASAEPPGSGGLSLCRARNVSCRCDWQVASLLRENAGAKTEAGLKVGDLQQRLSAAQTALDREREAFGERKVRAVCLSSFPRLHVRGMLGCCVLVSVFCGECCLRVLSGLLSGLSAMRAVCFFVRLFFLSSLVSASREETSAGDALGGLPNRLLLGVLSFCFCSNAFFFLALTFTTVA